MPYFLTSTLLFLLGLGIIVWVHSQYHMDIVVTPAEAPADRAAHQHLRPGAK